MRRQVTRLIRLTRFEDERDAPLAFGDEMWYHSWRFRTREENEEADDDSGRRL